MVQEQKARYPVLGLVLGHDVLELPQLRRKEGNVGAPPHIGPHRPLRLDDEGHHLIVQEEWYELKIVAPHHPVGVLLHSRRLHGKVTVGDVVPAAHVLGRGDPGIGRAVLTGKVPGPGIDDLEGRRIVFHPRSLIQPHSQDNPLVPLANDAGAGVQGKGTGRARRQGLLVVVYAVLFVGLDDPALVSVRHVLDGLRQQVPGEEAVQVGEDVAPGRWAHGVELHGSVFFPPVELAHLKLDLLLGHVHVLPRGPAHGVPLLGMLVAPLPSAPPLGTLWGIADDRQAGLLGNAHVGNPLFQFLPQLLPLRLALGPLDGLYPVVVLIPQLGVGVEHVGLGAAQTARQKRDVPGSAVSPHGLVGYSLIELATTQELGRVLAQRATLKPASRIVPIPGPDLYEGIGMSPVILQEDLAPPAVHAPLQDAVVGQLCLGQDGRHPQHAVAGVEGCAGNGGDGGWPGLAGADAAHDVYVTLGGIMGLHLVVLEPEAAEEPLGEGIDDGTGSLSPFQELGAYLLVDLGAAPLPSIDQGGDVIFPVFTVPVPGVSGEPLCLPDHEDQVQFVRG